MNNMESIAKKIQELYKDQEFYCRFDVVPRKLHGEKK